MNFIIFKVLFIEILQFADDMDNFREFRGYK